MAQKVYRWVDSEGRDAMPPPDPFSIAEKRARGDYRFGSEADERKVYLSPHMLNNSENCTVEPL